MLGVVEGEADSDPAAGDDGGTPGDEVEPPSCVPGSPDEQPATRMVTRTRRGADRLTVTAAHLRAPTRSPGQNNDASGSSTLVRGRKPRPQPRSTASRVPGTTPQPARAPAGA